MRKILLLTGFFMITPAVLLFALLFLAYLVFQKNPTALAIDNSQRGISYAALPSMAVVTTGQIGQVDVRVEIVKRFFANYGSPLEPFAQNIVSAAVHNGIDFRLLPAIAMQESNLCKKAPKGSHNCWGFGIYGKKKTAFKNYPQAINTVSKTLAKEYKAKGLDTPEEIVRKYTPSDNGTWVNGVLHFMNVLQ